MVSLEKNDCVMLVCQLLLKFVVLILVGGCGMCLKDLMNKCVKLVVYFGGKFCIIDFVLFNCLNFGICCIGVIIQYQFYMLVQYIQCGWLLFSEEMNEFVDLLLV